MKNFIRWITTSLISTLGLLSAAPSDTSATQFGAAKIVHIRVELTPNRWFAKTQKIIIPVLPNGQPGAFRSGDERTFYHLESVKADNGAVTWSYVGDQRFFGLAVTVRHLGELTTINISDSTLLGISVTPDKLSEAASAYSNDFSLSFTGARFETHDRAQLKTFKRVVCTVE